MKERAAPRTYADSIREMTPKTEADIAERVCHALLDEGWDVYPEVKLSEFLPRKAPGGVADAIAVKGNLAMVVEAKKTFSLDLLEQSIEWTKLFPLVAMAVPFSAIKNRHVLKEHLREHFGLGLFGVSVNHVNFSVQPRLLRHNLRFVDEIRGVLDPRMKLSTSGARSTYRHSRYQDFLWYVRIALAQHGPMTEKAIIAAISADKGNFHYSTASSMKQQMHAAIRSFEADLVLQDDGRVVWDPEKCPHGEAYVKRIRDVARMISERAEKAVSRSAEETQ